MRLHERMIELRNEIAQATKTLQQYVNQCDGFESDLVFSLLQDKVATLTKLRIELKTLADVEKILRPVCEDIQDLDKEVLTEAVHSPAQMIAVDLTGKSVTRLQHFFNVN